MIDTSTRLMPAPGIYRGIPAAHYHQWPAASSSRLKVLATQSAAHLKALLDAPKASTPAQELGTMLHTLVLQPALFPHLYEIRPAGKKGTKAFDRAAERILAERPFVSLVKAEDWDRIHRCRDAVLAHELAGPAMSGDDRELSIVWQDSKTGVMCKARLDAPLPDVGIWDLKKTRDARPRAWGSDAWSYRYDLQAAFYLRGAFEVGLRLPAEFGFVAVEDQPPFAIRLYDFGGVAGKVLNAAEVEVDALLELWARCASTGQWPGYPAHVEAFPAPGWAMAQIQDETLEAEAA